MSSEARKRERLRTDPEYRERYLRRRRLASANRRLRARGIPPPPRAESTPDEKRERARRWRQDNPDRIAELVKRHRAKEYGIAPSDIDAMLTKQGGRCAVCGVSDKLHIDHNHVTGVVRGMLCSFCNRGIGMFRDEPDRLRAAAAYLERPPAVEQPKDEKWQRRVHRCSVCKQTGHNSARCPENSKT